ncbi:MAG: alpha-amylase domain-containing protein, partial [Flavitalea sp.]
EIKRWGKWYLEQIPFDGVRLDAVKHIAPQFFNEWLDYMRTIKPDLFAVGEYWAPGELPLLLKYIEATNERMSLFDASLHHNLHNASKQGKDFDLTTIFNDSLVGVKPQLAVTVVDNHDTQPLQSLEAPVEAWFKPHAYSLILLREGGYPTVFYPDLFGAHYTDKGNDGNEHEIFLDKARHIEELLMARKLYAYGQQRDYFDHPNCIGWTREGVEENSNSGCAVLLSNSEDGFKSMEIGKQFTGKPFVDMLGTIGDEVVINEDGWGEFRVNAGAIAVWVLKEALPQ